MLQAQPFSMYAPMMTFRRALNCRAFEDRELRRALSSGRAALVAKHKAQRSIVQKFFGTGRSEPTTVGLVQVMSARVDPCVIMYGIVPICWLDRLLPQRRPSSA